MRSTKSWGVVPSLVLAIFMLAAIGACAGEATTATTINTDLTPQERLLSWLPASTTDFLYVEIETVLGRPVFQSEVDTQFDRLIYVTGEVITEELLRAAEIKNGVFGFVPENRHDYEASILEGDFQQLLEALEQSEADGLTETYRGIVIYGFEDSRPFYLAVVDRSELVLGQSAARVKEIVDRMQDGGEVPQALREAMADLGQADLLYFVPVKADNSDVSSNPFAAVTSRSWAVSANDAAASTVRTRFEFVESEQAVAAAALFEESESVWSLVSGTDSSDGQGSQDERTVMIEGILPDQDVGSAILGN